MSVLSGGGRERVCYDSKGSGEERRGEEEEGRNGGGGVIGWLLVFRWGWKNGKRREVVVLFCILPRTKSPSRCWDIHTLGKPTRPQQPRQRRLPDDTHPRPPGTSPNYPE